VALHTVQNKQEESALLPGHNHKMS